ncbi:MAG: hypothetical protein N2645_21145 [Clostridia bacterium]|nr:hypothetical protein [Clostridia bacterium]
MSENTQTCQCCGDANKTTITNREKWLIKLAYDFAIRDTAAVKQSIVSARSEGITAVDIKELCSIIAESSKESILSIIEEKREVKKNSCCV